MKFVIVSLEKKLKNFERIIRNDLKKLESIPLFKKFVYFEIYLVGSRFMKKNVLSYLAPKMPRPDVKGRVLGEIYLNPLYIRKNNESIDRMLVHSLLHLLGYTHQRKNDRIKMERKERQVLEKL